MVILHCKKPLDPNGLYINTISALYKGLPMLLFKFGSGLFWYNFCQIPLIRPIMVRKATIIHENVLCRLFPHKGWFWVWNSQKTQKKYKMAY